MFAADLSKGQFFTMKNVKNWEVREVPPSGLRTYDFLGFKQEASEK